MLFAQLQMLILVLLSGCLVSVTNVKLLAWCPKFTVDFGVTLGLYFSSLFRLLFYMMEESEGMIAKIWVSPFSFPFCFLLPSLMFCCSLVRLFMGTLSHPVLLPASPVIVSNDHSFSSWKLALSSSVVAASVCSHHSS